MASAATIQVAFRSKDAQRSVEQLDKRLEKLDQSVSGLAKTFERITDSIEKVVKPLETFVKAIAKMEVARLARENQELSDTLTKIRTNFRRTTKNLSDMAKAKNKLENEANKLNKTMEKTGKRLMIYIPTSLKAGQNTKFLEKDVGRLNNALKKLSFNLKMGDYLFTALIQTIGTFIAQNVVGYIIRMTDQFKLMESRLRVVNEDFSTLNTNLNSTVSIALATRQSLFAVGNLMARVGRNSTELKKDTLALAQATETISKGFQVAGATAEEARNAIVQLSQALASGRLQGDELRSILELAPTLAEAISHSIGITVGQLRAFAREGLITTKVILSAMAESTDKINKDFAKIRPTISQALTNVQTAVQAFLGTNDIMKLANDELARSFMSLANFIRNFARNKESLDGIAETIKNLSQNIIPLAAGLTNFVVKATAFILAAKGIRMVLGAVAAASKAFMAALLSGAGVIAAFTLGLKALLPLLGLLAAGYYTLKTSVDEFNKTKDSFGLMATQAESLSEVLENVETKIKKMNEEAARLNKEGVDDLKELTIKFNALTESINFSAEAIKQLRERIKEQEAALKKFSGSAEEKTRNTLVKIEKFVLYIVDSITYVFQLIVRLAELAANAVIYVFQGLRGQLNRLVDIIVPDALEELFGEDYSKRSEKMLNDSAEAARDFGQAFKELGKNTVDFYNILKKGYSDSQMTFSNLYRLSAEDQARAIADNNILLDKLVQDQFDKTEEQRKIAVESERNTRKLILDQIKASSQAAIDQYRLEARLARAAFDLAFEEPFNMQLQSTQGGLDKLAAGYQKDFNKFLQTLVPDASFDITKLIFQEGKGSSFLAEGFMNTLVKGLSARNANIKDLQSSDIIEALGGDVLSKNIVKSVMASGAVVTAVESLTEKGIKPLIEDQLLVKSAEFLEKYASNLVQTILTTQIRLMTTLRRGLQSAINEESNLRLQVASDKFFKKAGKTRLGQLAKENFLITEQRNLNRAIEISKHAQEGLDITADSNAAELARKVIAVKDEIAEITRQRKTQQELDAMEYENIDSGRKIESLRLERDELMKGSSELEIQRKKRELLKDEDEKILKFIRENNIENEETISLFQKMIDRKYELLDIEQEITAEIKAQQDLQRTEEDLIEARYMKEAEFIANRQFQELTFAQKAKVAIGKEEDPREKIKEDIKTQIQAAIDSDYRIGVEFVLDSSGNLQFIEEELAKLSAAERSAREQAFLNRLSISNIENQQTNPLSTRTDKFFFSSKEKGGLLNGPSHSKGGVKGFLYGQPIEMEGGEYIISKDAVSKYGIQIFDMLNAKKFAPGGYTGPTKIGPIGELLSDEDLNRILQKQKRATSGDPRIIQGTIKMLEKEKENRKNIINEQNAIEEAKTEEIIKSTNALKSQNDIVKDANKIDKKTIEAKEIELENIQSTHSEMKLVDISSEINRSVQGIGYAASTLTETFEESTEHIDRLGYAASSLSSFGDPALGFAGTSMDQRTINMMPFPGPTGQPPGFFEGTVGFGYEVISTAANQDSDFRQAKDDFLNVYSDLESLFTMGFAEPMTGLIKVTADRLFQNERFQKSLDRFLSLFYDLFDEFAEGFAIFFEALVDALEPLRPLMKMIGGALREILRSLSTLFKPVARLLESLQPILIYISGILQVVVEVINFFVGAIAGVLDQFVVELLDFFDIDTSNKYKSLNLLRQEQEILSGIQGSIDGLANSLLKINDVIFDIVNSTLNIAAPSIKLENATNKYLELFDAASAFGADDEIVNEFTQFAKQYLEQAQSVLKTSSAYQQLYVQVIEDLESLQGTAAAEVGEQITQSLKSGLFQLEVAGSSMGENIVGAVEKFKEGILSFDDLTTFIGFKLSQIQDDIDLKEFADFGSLGPAGDEFGSNLAERFENFRRSEQDRINKATGEALSSTSLEDDLRRLFGINLAGERLGEGFAGLVESEMVLAKEAGGQRLNALLRAQPTIGDVSRPTDLPERPDDPTPPSLGDFGIDLVDMIAKFAQAIYDALLGALETLFTNVEKFLKALFSFIEKLGITAIKFLEELFGAIFSNTVEALQGLGKFFESIFGDAAGSTITFLQGLVSFFTEIFNQGGTKLGFLDGLINFFSQIFTGGTSLSSLQGLTEFFTKILKTSGLLTPLQGFLNLLSNIFNIGDSKLGLVEAFQKILSSILKSTGLLDLSAALTTILDKIFGTGGNTAVDALTKFIEKLFTGSLTADGVLGKLFTQLFGEDTADPLTALGKFFTSTLGGEAADPTSAVGKFIEELLNGTTDAISAIGKFIDEALSNTVGGDVILSEIFKKAERAVRDIFMFKNPFNQFGIGEEYLLKFAEGGLLEGRSHKEGGIRTRVGKTPVELEGGEFIIKKSTVDHFGENFFHSINNLDPIELGRFSAGKMNDFKREVNVQRFGEGGSFLRTNTTSFSKNLIDTFVGLGKDLTNFTGVKNPSVKQNAGEGAHLSKNDPETLRKENKDLPTLRFFDVSLSPSKHLEGVVGKTNVDMKLGFPENNSADINILGQSVKFENGGKVFHKMGSSNENAGSLIDTSFSTDRASLTTGDITKGGLSKLDVTKTLKLPPGDISNLLQGAFGTLFDVVEGLLKLVGNFGVIVKNNLTKFIPTLGLNLSGEAEYEQRGGLETLFTFFAALSLLDWLAGYLGQGADSLAVKDSPLNLATFGTLFGKRNTGPLQDVPFFLLPFLGVLPLPGSPGGLSIADKLELLYTPPEGSDQSAQSSFFDFLRVGQEGGTSPALATSLFYGVIAASVADFLTPDRGFAAGGHLSAENTGMAIGPSHQSGMLGVTKKGSPFLFEGGEYIINKNSAQRIGKSRLDALNSYGGGGVLPEFGNSTEYVDYGKKSSLLDDALSVLTFNQIMVERQNAAYKQTGPSFLEGMEILGKTLLGLEAFALLLGIPGIFLNRGKGGRIPQYQTGGGFAQLGMAGLAGLVGFLGASTISEALTDKPIPLDTMNAPGGIEIIGPSRGRTSDEILKRVFGAVAGLVGIYAAFELLKRAFKTDEETVEEATGVKKPSSPTAPTAPTGPTGGPTGVPPADDPETTPFTKSLDEYRKAFAPLAKHDVDYAYASHIGEYDLLGSKYMGASYVLADFSDPSGTYNYENYLNDDTRKDFNGLPFPFQGGEKKNIPLGIRNGKPYIAINKDQVFTPSGNSSSYSEFEKSFDYFNIHHGPDAYIALRTSHHIGGSSLEEKYNEYAKSYINGGPQSNRGRRNDLSYDSPFSNDVHTTIPSLLLNDPEYNSLNHYDQLAISLLHNHKSHPFYGKSNKNYVNNYIRKRKGIVGEELKSLPFYERFLSDRGLTYGSGGQIPEFGTGTLDEFLNGKPAPGFKNADPVFDDVYNILMLDRLMNLAQVESQGPSVGRIKNPLAAGSIVAAVLMGLVEILSPKKMSDDRSKQDEIDRERVGRNRAIAGALGLGALFTYLGYGEGGLLPEFGIGTVSRERGKLSRAEKDVLGRNRRSSMFGLGSIFGVSAQGTHSLARNQRNLNKKNQGIDFLDILGYGLLSGVGIFGISEFIKNNPNLFSNGGIIPEAKEGGDLLEILTIISGLGAIGAFQLSQMSPYRGTREGKEFGGLFEKLLGATFGFGLMGMGSGGKLPTLQGGGASLFMGSPALPLLTLGLLSEYSGSANERSLFGEVYAGMLGSVIGFTGLNILRENKNRNPLIDLFGLIFAGLGGLAAYQSTPRLRSNNFGSGGRIRTLQTGGMAKGPSHQSGMVGYAPGGGPFMFEGGEYIINKRSTARIGEDRLNALNSYGMGGILPEFQEGRGVYGSGRLGPAFARRDLLGLREGDPGEFTSTYSSAIGGEDHSQKIEGPVSVIEFSQKAIDEMALAHIFALSKFQRRGSLDEQIAMALLPPLLQAGIYRGALAAGESQAGAALAGQAAGGIMTAALIARGQADEGRQDIAMISAIAAGATIAILAGPGLAAIGALVVGMYLGDMDRYMADYNAEDLTEPFEGIVEEFMELEAIGVPNYIREMGGKIEDIFLRLSEGFTNFGEYLSGTMFANAGTGVRQAMDEIQIALEHEFKKLINEGIVAFVTQAGENFLIQSVQGGALLLAAMMEAIFFLPIRIFEQAIPQEVATFMANEMGSLSVLIKNLFNEIMRIPNRIIDVFEEFYLIFADFFGIEVPAFELQALKNPFHSTLGGPEFIIDIQIGEDEKGDGGLVGYSSGGVLQTGGLAKGPSHQSGMLGLTSKGSPFLFEGGEYIVNKKTTNLLGEDFMSGINSVRSDSDLQDVFSMLSVFQSGGGLFNLNMNDNPLFSVFKIPNPLVGLDGPNEFSIKIDPSKDLSSIDIDQNLFENGGSLFDIAGNVFGNSFEKDFLSVDNPFTKIITVVERYQREVNRYGFMGKVIGTVLEWATRTVSKLVQLGPDELKLGLKGNLLDFYNSKVTSNFGTDILERLNIDSLPTPTMSKGGLIYGPSHENGGVLAEMEGGEYVMNRDSVSNVGLGILNGLNTGGGSFTDRLVSNSSMNNQLLSRLIEVVEEKEMSVTVVNDDRGTTNGGGDIRMSREREMSYRGARNIA